MERLLAPAAWGSVALAGLLFAACSSGGPGSASGTTGGGRPATTASAGGGSASGDISHVDACALLGPDDIKNVLGVAMKAGVNQDSNIVRQCEWEPQDDNVLLTVGLDVRAYTDDDWQTMLAFRHDAVSGIGEEAYRNSPTTGNLTVKYHGYEVDLDIVNFSTRPQAEIDHDTDSLMKVVLSRL